MPTYQIGEDKAKPIWYPDQVPTKVCTVRGKDFQGMPLTVNVTASSLLEAAAAGLEEILKQNGKVSEVLVTIHEPGQSRTVQFGTIAKWIKSGGGNLSVFALKRRVRELLEQTNGHSLHDIT